MLHQQTEETQGCHDDHIVIALFAAVTGQQEFGVILIYRDLKHTTDTGGDGLNRRLRSIPVLVFKRQHSASQSLGLNSVTPNNPADAVTKYHLSSIELEEGEIGLAGDPVEAKDAVHHSSPNPDQTICDRLARLPQPGARASELPPDHVYHVVLVVFLL